MTITNLQVRSVLANGPDCASLPGLYERSGKRKEQARQALSLFCGSYEPGPQKGI
jgi:hypothetical protein